MCHTVVRHVLNAACFLWVFHSCWNLLPGLVTRQDLTQHLLNDGPIVLQLGTARPVHFLKDQLPTSTSGRRHLLIATSFCQPQPVTAVVGGQQHICAALPCIRCPGNILHPVDRADASAAQISSEAYIKKWGHELKYPGLFCVAVLHKAWQGHRDKQQRYKTWPLECCW